MKYALEDLGIAAFSDVWITWRLVRDPRDGRELALSSLSRGGFILIDPRDRKTTHIECERPFSCAWAIAQAPNGDIYQCDYGSPDPKLAVWKWHGPTSRVVAEPVVSSIFTIDVAPDGRVYIPDYSTNLLHRYDPASHAVESLGSFKDLTPHIRNVVCGRDGWVYILGYGYTPTGGDLSLISFDPATGKQARVELPKRTDGLVFRPSVTRDGEGRAVIAATRWGRSVWFELVKGQPQAIDQATVRLNEKGSPLVFGDGGYIREVQWQFKGIVSHSLDEAQLAADALPAPAKPAPDTSPAHAPVAAKAIPPIASRTMHGKVDYVASDGKAQPFDIEHDGSPLRIFSVARGGDRIWGGTFIPLRMFSFDPAANTYHYYGNPSPSGGEIYNMVFSAGKLFLASYTDCTLTRYDPARPYRNDNSAQANPMQLGRMKDYGLSLQRPHGRAMDSRGNVYFSAYGGYGCEDSGLVRIDPNTEEVTRWIFNNTSITALVYIASLDRLMFTERRKGETAIRFTIVNPSSGAIEWSEPVIEDGGEVFSLLDSPEGVIYGMHAWRATLFTFDVRKMQIVNRLPEMRVGEHCHNALTDGPDGRIWGLTNSTVYAVSRDFKQVESLAKYPDHAGGNAYRFGLCFGPDGCLYIPNGTHLMRMRIS